LTWLPWASLNPSRLPADFRLLLVVPDDFLVANRTWFHNKEDAVGCKRKTGEIHIFRGFFECEKVKIRGGKAKAERYFDDEYE
jgi:hypothetical protein